MQKKPQFINREDMLELTRRMTLSRNCFSRITGAYLDEEGFVDGTFNRHFQRLTRGEQQKNLELAKTVPFAKTNEQLKEYCIPEEAEGRESFWQLLMALRDCELKNDALLDVLYEKIGSTYTASGPYAFYLFYGCYDVPKKASDKESLWESEEVYSFLIGTICPVFGDYEVGAVESGFLFPAFRERSGEEHRIDVFGVEEKQGDVWLALLGLL